MAQQDSGSSRRWIGGVAALAVCVPLFFVVRGMSHGKVLVRVANVTYQDIRSKVSTNGKVEPLQDFQAPAPMPGVVAKLLVSVGQKVLQGQELVQLDDSDARSRVVAAQSTLTAAEAQLQNMKNNGTAGELLSQNNDLQAAVVAQQQAAKNYAALQALQTKGAASGAEVDAARQKKQDADAREAQLQTMRTGRYGASDIATQESMVNQARAGVSAASSGLASVDIRAPFSGTVYSVPVSAHDFVSTGEALLNVADLSHLEVRAYFDEPEVGKLSAGQPVDIAWDAKPLQMWHGHILQAPTTIISYGTRNVGECVITVDDAKGDLLPNTNVTVTVTTQEKKHVLSVPREALHTEGMNNFVYMFVADRLVKTPVQLGVVNLTLVELTGGLNEGDAVALGATNETELSDGLEVKAQP